MMHEYADVTENPLISPPFVIRVHDLASHGPHVASRLSFLRLKGKKTFCAEIEKLLTIEINGVSSKSRSLAY